MEYKGKLYGKCGSMLIPLSNSTDDWDAMVKQISELKAKMAEDMEAFAEWTAFMQWIYDPTDKCWFQKHSSETKITTQLREMWEQERGEK